MGLISRIMSSFKKEGFVDPENSSSPPIERRIITPEPKSLLVEVNGNKAMIMASLIETAPNEMVIIARPPEGEANITLPVQDGDTMLLFRGKRTKTVRVISVREANRPSDPDGALVYIVRC